VALVQRLFLSLFILIVIAVHGIAPGSARFCTMKEASQAERCPQHVQSKSQFIESNCCGDECMKGSIIHLPTTELSPKLRLELKNVNLITNSVLFTSLSSHLIADQSAIDQSYFVGILSNNALENQQTRLAKLQTFLI
jgi:hypothetical protein